MKLGNRGVNPLPSVLLSRITLYVEKTKQLALGQGVRDGQRAVIRGCFDLAPLAKNTIQKA